MDSLDAQMVQWSARLRDDIGILPPESHRLASGISEQVTKLADDAKQRVRSASPFPLSVRIEELQAFQAWMDLAGGSTLHPAVSRCK